MKENKYFRANNRTLKDKMTSISNALKVIVNLKCFENKDILESDTTIIMMISDKNCDETLIEGIFDFSGFLVGLLFTDRKIIGQKYFFFCLRFSICCDQTNTSPNAF